MFDKIIIILLSLITILIGLFSNSNSSILFFILICFISLAFSKTIEKGKRDPAQKLILISLLYFGTLALLHYVDTICYHHILYSDESERYIPIVERCQNMPFNLGFSKAINDTTVTSIGYKGYLYIVLYIGEKFLGEYNVMLLFLSTVLIACFYIIYIYKLLLIYLTPRQSYKYSLYFLLFSPIVLYSFAVLRDSHIAFIYLIGIYICLKKSNALSDLFLLVSLAFLVGSFRFTNGVFFSLFILYYIYAKLKLNRVIKIFILTLFGFFLIGANLSGEIQESFDTVDKYQDYTLDNANSDGMAAKLLTLPSPVKEIFCTILSQVFPIPPWAVFEMRTPESIPEFIITILNPIKTIFWFYIIFFTCTMLFNKICRTEIFNQFGILLLIALVYIIACSSEYYEVRRLMAVYPIIYVSYCIMRCNLVTNTFVHKTNKRFIVLYGGFILLFVLLFRL